MFCTWAWGCFYFSGWKIAHECDEIKHCAINSEIRGLKAIKKWVLNL